MRSTRSNDKHAPRLQPAGRRWGFGAHSVMPYLSHTGQAATSGPAGDDGSIRNPVFPHMENGLRAMRRGH
jgi:hypothetical protein